MSFISEDVTISIAVFSMHTMVYILFPPPPKKKDQEFKTFRKKDELLLTLCSNLAEVCDIRCHAPYPIPHTEVIFVLQQKKIK